MARKVSFSNQELQVHEIDVHYTICAAALRAYYIGTNSAFVGYTNNQLKTELHGRLEELNKSCSFLLLTVVEARLRIDYLKRCYEKRKDDLSRRFRKINKECGEKRERPDLSDDILDAWKQHGASAPLVSEIRGAWNYRNWLAHGRYWKPKLGRKYDYRGLFELTSAVERLIQNAP